jgi:hypothetical protein
MAKQGKRWRSWLGRSVVVLAALAMAAMVWVRMRMQGPHRSYRADIEFASAAVAGETDVFEVGVAARNITPDLAKFDPWKDVDGDSRFRPDRGDTWEDRNGNGDFDFVWLGGFNINRPAQGVNDPLWARAVAFRHGGVVVAVVSIDSIGLTHERFIEPRLELAREFPQLRQVVFASTHTHNAPDTMGIWSYRPIPSKFNHDYVHFVVNEAKLAVAEAIRGLRPAQATLAAAEVAPEGFVRDSRQPIVTDRVLSAARFTVAGTEETIATLVSWGNHPEAMGGDNPLVSSDFPHYLRDAMEHGLAGEGGMAGFGGTCVFLQGPVGGLMTPLGLEVPDRNGREVHRTNGVGKARALGENLALRCAAGLRGPTARTMKDRRLAGVAKTVFAPIEGTFKIPIMLGLIHPGWFDGKARTEVGAFKIGEIALLTIPGEIYPEIVDGGVEAPDGADFEGPAVEVPPLRQEMSGALNLVANLANDEIGYIVPRTQWDTRPPFTYGRKDAPYGEENSGGPDVAQVIHAESLAALRRLKEVAGGTDR